MTLPRLITNSLTARDDILSLNLEHSINQLFNTKHEHREGIKNKYLEFFFFAAKLQNVEKDLKFEPSRNRNFFTHIAQCSTFEISYSVV